MHPAMSHDLAQAYQYDLQRHAERDALVRAARRARRTRPGYTAPRPPAAGRRLLAIMGRQS